jgi:histone acetyltransferase (RNA polymerase elongator complex component)
MNINKNHGAATQTLNSQIHQPAASGQNPVSNIRHPASSTQQPASPLKRDLRFTPTSNRPFIIPVFLPHAGCPHQCVFCNQISITGSRRNTVDAEQIRAQIHQFLGYKNHRRKPVQISFYGGNFLGLNDAEIIRLLDLAAEFIKQGHVDSIRFSTRPDTITPEHLNIIVAYPVATIELGVQSMDDQVLALAERGHSAADTVRAVEQLKKRRFDIGLQMMVGLPGDNEGRSLATACQIAALEPDFVRIYPTLVVNNSKLARWYHNGSYKPLSLADAVAQVKKLYLLFREYKIRVIRMGLQASEDLEGGSTVLAGPYHPAFGHLVYSEIFYDKTQKALNSIKNLADSISISVNPRSISEMRGLGNSNVKKLKERYPLKSIKVVPDASLAADDLMLRQKTSKSSCSC